MADAASKQALEEGKKRLREFLEASDAGRQAMAMSSQDEIEMKRMNGRVRAKEEEEDEDI